MDEQTPLPVTYKKVRLDRGYRLDLVVENRIIVEIKAVEKLDADPRSSVTFVPPTDTSVYGPFDEFPSAGVERWLEENCE